MPVSVFTPQRRLHSQLLARYNIYARRALYSGFMSAEQYDGNPALAGLMPSVMKFWFLWDLIVPECLNKGGTGACPCDTPDFWNVNWHSNVNCSVL